MPIEGRPREPKLPGSETAALRRRRRLKGAVALRDMDIQRSGDLVDGGAPTGNRRVQRMLKACAEMAHYGVVRSHAWLQIKLFDSRHALAVGELVKCPAREQHV